MNEFYNGFAEILEVSPHDISPSFDLNKVAWDSLAIVSTIALVDESFGVMLDGRSLAACNSVADIEKLIAAAQG
jgi:acyl carrier protein